MPNVTTIAPDGTVAVTSVQSNDYILKQLVSAKVPSPRSCMGGTCGECTALLESGEPVDMHDQAFLTPEEVKGGFILPCVAYALGDCVLRTHQQDAVIDFSHQSASTPLPLSVPAIASLNPGYGFLHDKMRGAVLQYFDEKKAIQMVKLDVVEAKVVLKNERVLSPSPNSPEYDVVSVTSIPAKDDKKVVIGIHGYAVVFKTWPFNPKDFYFS